MKVPKINSSFLISALALIVSITALFINNNNTRRQIELTIKNQKVQTLIALGQYLHQPAFSDARSRVRNNQIEPIINDTFVRRVCSSFGFAGSLVRNNAVDKKEFLDYWASAIIIFDRTLPETIWKEDAGMGIPASDYYADFLWLINEANKLERYKDIKSRVQK